MAAVYAPWKRILRRNSGIDILITLFGKTFWEPSFGNDFVWNSIWESISGAQFRNEVWEINVIWKGIREHVWKHSWGMHFGNTFG